MFSYFSSIFFCLIHFLFFFFFLRNILSSQTLEPEKARDAPLCSIQYRALFHACRIPAKPVDHVVGYDPEKCFHIVVMRNNRFFVFDIIRPSTGAPLTEDELQIQLKRILDLAGTQTALPLGVLTTSHRDTWSDLRTQLLHAHPSHPGLFETLESAMCVLCLDTTSPKTLEDMARTCWHGDGRNRWFDKSFQLIVCENGKAGFNGEHSLMDATVTGRLCESILTHCFSPSSSSSSESLKHPQGHHDLPAPKELVFQLTSFQSSIESAQYQFDQLVQAHEVQVLAFHGFGKDAIKQWGMSPDAFVQMALQLAYYKMYGHWRATYETAQTRKFKYGRTETGRTVSLESVAFLKGMCSPTLTAPQKIKLLKSAAQYHHRYMTDASEGKGVDRHLLGLKLSVLPNEPIPDVFSHPSFKASSHWALSTSQLTSELFDGYGWGPVVTDGYGLAYMIKRKSIHVNIACQHLRADRFRQYLIEALQDMKKLFDDAPETNKSKL
ncbi:Carnitine O-acetyltransferase mitochondrial [Coelomomyces lativittatus]|nr:Carnitine O-acetyltransferase mitochondrial [Coelomomyces lativittatus]